MQNSSTTKINPAKQVTAPNWNPKHFRLFVGNLGPDGNDELLKEAFLKYPSMSQVHVLEIGKPVRIRDLDLLPLANLKIIYMHFKK